MNTEQFKQWCDFHSDLTTSPLIMGILNVTPDSFSDGGRYYQLEHALEQAHRMIAEGADLIDIGGESTKPGTLAISYEEEQARVIPIIKQLRAESDVCISIDTTKAQIMHDAIHAGASIINDIAGFRNQGSLVMAAQLGVPLCLMHMQGEPHTMQNDPQYTEDVVDEINVYFQERIDALVAAGVRRNHIILDPGFGFGKTVQHNMRLVNQIGQFQQHNLPVLLGASRKSTLGTILNAPVDKRLAGGLAIALFAALQGVAIIRTHDVAETKQAFLMLQAINAAGTNKMRNE